MLDKAWLRVWAGALLLAGCDADEGRAGPDAPRDGEEDLQRRIACKRVDWNGDGEIGTGDLVFAFQNHAYEAPCPGCVGDANRDGTFGSGDLVALLTVGYGTRCEDFVFHSLDEIREYAVLDWVDAVPRAGIELDEYDLGELGGGRTLQNLATILDVPVKHPNGVVDVPEWTHARVEEWSSRWGDDAGLAQIEALIVEGLWDDTNPVHVALAVELLQATGHIVDEADIPEPAAACEVSCRLERTDDEHLDADWHPGKRAEFANCPDFGEVTSPGSIHELASYCDGVGSTGAYVRECNKTAYLTPTCVFVEHEDGACGRAGAFDGETCNLELDSDAALNSFYDELTQYDLAHGKTLSQLAAGVELSRRARASTGEPAWKPAGSDPWEMMFDSGGPVCATVGADAATQGLLGDFDDIDDLIDLLEATLGDIAYVEADCDDAQYRHPEDPFQTRYQGIECDYEGYVDELDNVAQRMEGDAYALWGTEVSIGAAGLQSLAKLPSHRRELRPYVVYPDGEVRIAAEGDLVIDTFGGPEDFASDTSGLTFYAQVGLDIEVVDNDKDIACTVHRGSRYDAPHTLTHAGGSVELTKSQLKPNVTVADARCGRGRLGMWDPPVYEPLEEPIACNDPADVKDPDPPAI